MPQASISVTEVAGSQGTTANTQQQARQIAILGVSPGGTVNTIYQPGSQPGAVSTFGTGGPLVEEAALALAVPGAPPPLLVPLTQSSAGAVSGSAGLMAANGANAGAGTLNVTCGPHLPIKVKCTITGALGTAAFQFSTDGGTTYGAAVTSVNADSSSPWTYAVPGTFCILSFAYGSPTSYTSTKTLTVGVDGTVTNGAAWTGAVTQASSPLDTYELLATVKKAGALGTAIIDVSLDNGFSATTYFVPSSGVVVVTDGRGNYTGLVITAASTFSLNDTYTGYALPPAPSSAAVTAAITAMIASASRPTVCNIHIQALPTSASNAFALAASVQTVLDTAFASGLDWQAFVECPSSVSGDIVMSGGVPAVDTADTDAVIQTARAAATASNRVAVHCTTGGIVSPLTSIRTRRPFGWATVQRYLATDPRQSLGRPADGPLNYKIGARDEKLASIQLGDVQINVPTTYDGYPGCYLNITSGGFALKNLTVSTLYQDAETLRALNIVAAACRVQGMAVLADRPPANADNTIAESAARDYDTLFDTAVKRAVGMKSGGAFGTTPQVSSVSASILRSSVVGASPRRLDVAVPFKGLGMISAEAIAISVQGG